MFGYVLKRLLAAVPVLLGLTLIAFGIMAAIPGDPATAILGSYATPENVAKLNRDKPLQESIEAIDTRFLELINALRNRVGPNTFPL